jgi:hypothetical protein
MAVMTVGLTAANQRCTATARTWRRTASTPAPSTDDRPFLYLRDPGVPSLYRRTLLLIIAGSALAVAFVLVLNALSRRRRSPDGDPDGPTRKPLATLGAELLEVWRYRDLFLLGVAFLLLETKSVTGFALLFGTTWLVNAFVFAGVLLAVLAAVELTARVRTPPVPVMYAVLVGALALSWVVPSSWLLRLDVPLRVVVAVAIAVLPIFAANVIFAKRFSETGDAPLAFGANLLGAIVGGCLEYLSLEFGYRALLIIAGVVYLLALLLRPRTRARAEPVPEEHELGGPQTVGAGARG